jgi:RNA polymerase sigma factor, sigma-70 family
MSSNEELAVQAQNGNNKAQNALYEGVKKLLSSMCFKYYINKQATCERAGITIDDLKQEAYFAFLEAVKSYKPESGFMFTTYLNFPVLNVLNKLVGLRGKTNALNISCSLDAPIGEDSETTRGDLTPDSNAEADFENLINDLYDKQLSIDVENALAQLDEVQREVIHSIFYKGLTNQKAGLKRNLTGEQVRQIEFKALTALRKPKSPLNKYRDEYIYSLGLSYTGFGAFKNSWTSSTERAAFKLIEQHNSVSQSKGVN